MLKKPHYIAFGLVALLTLIVLNLPHHTANQLKLAIGSLFLPLFGLSKTTQQAAREAGNAVVPRAELIKLNEQLRQTNQLLQIRAMQAAALQRENDQLRSQLAWQRQAPWKLRLANVVGRDPANWWQTILIDLGSRDGLRPNLDVLTPSGLVGRVSVVGLTSSQVILIGNPNCKVAVRVEKPGDRTSEQGVITGAAGPLENSLMTLSYLSSNTELKPGQRVVTSGEGGFFHRGIPVGQIAENSRQLEIGYTEARVKLSANLASLEEVWVLMP